MTGTQTLGGTEWPNVIPECDPSLNTGADWIPGKEVDVWYT